MMNLITDGIELELPTFDVTAPPPRGNCPSHMFDAVPVHQAVLRVLERELCPAPRCSDVDRAIMGASLGG